MNIRWDWVTGGRVGSGSGSGASGGRSSTPVQRSSECKLHRRKLHKRLLHQMQEMEAARRGIQVAIEQQQVWSFSFSINIKKSRLNTFRKSNIFLDVGVKSLCCRHSKVYDLDVLSLSYYEGILKAVLLPSLCL